MKTTSFFGSLAAVVLAAACAPKATEAQLTEAFDGAREAELGDPIAAASVLVTAPDGAPLCNGVLLGDGMIATASACVGSKAEKLRISAGGAALVPVLEVIKTDQVALLRVKFEALPQTARAASLAAGGTSVDGLLQIATFVKNGEKLAIAPGKIDAPESVPGYLALRLDSGGRMSVRQLGSGIYAVQDGKPVLVGIYATPVGRGSIAFVQDVRGRVWR